MAASIIWGSFRFVSWSFTSATTRLFDKAGNKPSEKQVPLMAEMLHDLTYLYMDHASRIPSLLVQKV